MRRFLAAAALMLALVGAGGCTWQANSGSQPVEINPFAVGSGNVFNSASGPGYMDGEPLDMRTRR
jgi:hypothetical protein